MRIIGRLLVLVVMAFAMGAGAPVVGHGGTAMSADYGASAPCNDEGNANGCASAACPSLSCLRLAAIIADARTGQSAVTTRWPTGLTTVPHGVTHPPDPGSPRVVVLS